MSRKTLIILGVVVLLVVCCGAVAFTPVGHAVGVTSSDCDLGDRIEGDSDCGSSHKSKGKKPKKAKKKK